MHVMMMMAVVVVHRAMTASHVRTTTIRVRVTTAPHVRHARVSAA
jgi:hypothetical protein